MTPNATIPRAAGKSMRLLLLTGLLALGASPAWANDISNGNYHTVDDNNTATPPDGWPAGMFPNQVEPAARAMMGATARWWERANPHLTTSSSGARYTLSTQNTAYPTAYTQGEIYCAKADRASRGNDTFQVNSLSALPLYVQTSSGLAKITANAIQASAMFCAAYDAALNSSAGGFQVLSNVVASTGGGGGGGSPTSPVIIASGNVTTGSSTILAFDLTSYVSTYNRFEIKLNKINPGLSSTGTAVQFSTASGASTWESAGYTWRSTCLCASYASYSSTVSGDTSEIIVQDGGAETFINGTIEITQTAITPLLQASISAKTENYISSGFISANGIKGVKISTVGGSVLAGSYEIIGYP